jgi:dUTP pyrophosphatase
MTYMLQKYPSKPRKQPQLFIKKLVKEAILPRKAGKLEAGFDFFTLPTQKRVRIDPGGRVSLKTGIAIEPPRGKFGMIRPRSSAFGRGLFVCGTIDESYRGEVFLVIYNIGNEPQVLEGGKAYAQMILIDYNPEIKAVEVKGLGKTERGAKGFGSSGHV